LREPEAKADMTDDSMLGASTVLVVDDNALNRELANVLLSDAGYQVIECEDGLGALQALEDSDVDVVLLDVMMPGMDGYETCRRIKSRPMHSLLPVVMLTALADVPSRVAALQAGADDFICKPFDESELLARVRASAGVKRLLDHLESTEGILFAMANLVETKDAYTDEHLKRMAHFSERMASIMGLTPMEQLAMRYAGILHDIGKVGISDMVLGKPSRLTPEEYEAVKLHSVLGDQIVRPLRLGDAIAPIVRGHHERWDGKGYPDGLVGEAIPIGARIVCVADTFDAMTSDRPYRAALPREDAVEELRKHAGTQFDPGIVDLFINHMDEIIDEAR
jgi:putative two-component system response regulator